VKRLALAALLALVTACGAEPGQAPQPRQALEWASLEAGWSELPAPPYEAACATSVWTGHELLYWGGDDSCQEGTARREGAAFDPVARTWRSLAPSPLDGRSSAAAAWTGEELLVWGGWGESARGDGAAYRPATDEWRLLAESPLEARIPAAEIWTGKELIVWGDVGRHGENVDGAAYDPAADTWRMLPPAPFALNLADAVWTGEEMVVYGALLDGNNWSRSEHARGLAYDPGANTWREISSYPLSPQASTVVWTGGEMIAWDYELRAGAYDPTADNWRRLPDLPLEFYECYPDGALAGERFVLAWHCGQAAILDLTAGTWREVPRPPKSVAGRAVAADDVVLFAGAWSGTGNTLWAYRPGPLGATAFVPHTERRGERDFLPLTFPDGDQVVLSYPLELDLAGMSVEPHIAYLYQDDLPPRFELDFVFGSAAPAPGQVAFRAGSWSVLAELRDPSEADTVVRSLRVHETADGFPVVEALPPLALSHESGEGGGPSLTLGVLGERWLEVAVEPGCGLPAPEISDGHGAKCFGDLYLGVEGDQAFIEAVLEGLRLEDS
jgi:hypothetical protein